VRARICSINATESERQRVLETVNALIPRSNLCYVVDEEGQGGFEATVHAEINRAALASLIWSVLRPERG